MSKKDNLPRPEVPPAQPPAQQPPQEERQPVSAAVIWTFWGAVLTALLSARILDDMLPLVPERVIERWVMLVFAAFLSVFLVKIR